MLDKEMHRKRRRIIAPVISDRSMRIFEPNMSQQIDRFLNQLLIDSRQSRASNMTPLCERLGVDIIGQLAFGYPLNTLVEPQHRVIIESLKNRSRRASLYYFWPQLKRLDRLFELIESNGNLGSLRGSLGTMIAARLAIPKDSKHDFFAMSSEHIGASDSDILGKDFWAEAALFIAAGGSTTSTAMSGAFFYLTHNPTVYSTLASEIRTTFSSGCEISQGLKLNSCKYLRAVIEETMRMSPSALTPAWREQDPASIGARESFFVDGHLIPPGTQVAVSSYSLQHNPAYFPEPYTFNPDRWLPPADDVNELPEQKEVRTTMRRAFAPFSIGERACAGKPMAYLEMSLVIAKTVWYFDFEKASGEDGKLGEGWPGRVDGRGRPDEFQLYDGIVTEHDGPTLVFIPRGDYHKDFEEVTTHESV